MAPAPTFPRLPCWGPCTESWEKPLPTPPKPVEEARVRPWLSGFMTGNVFVVLQRWGNLRARLLLCLPWSGAGVPGWSGFFRPPCSLLWRPFSSRSSSGMRNCSWLVLVRSPLEAWGREPSTVVGLSSKAERAFTVDLSIQGGPGSFAPGAPPRSPPTVVSDPRAGSCGR